MSTLSSKTKPDEDNSGRMSVERNNEKDVAAHETSPNERGAKISSSIDPDNEITGLRLLCIHSSICLCTLLVGLDFNMLATAIPVITSDFHAVNDVGWYGAAFYLTLCATQPLAGKMYTLFAKKLVYLAYVAVFEVGSLVCALSPNTNALIVGRAIAGIGGSGLLGGGLVIITTIIPLHKRAIWQGTWSMVFSTASIVGPLIGGALTQHVTWRWCFYINLPIGGLAASFFFFTFHVKKAPTEQAPLVQKLKSLDAIGSVLFVGFMTMLLFALQWGGVEYRWNSSIIIGLFIGAGVVACLFVPWQIYQGDEALIPPKLFASRNAGLICTGTFFVNGPFQTVVYWLPIWFQGVLGVTPVQSAIRYLPTVIADVLSALISAGIATKTGFWNPLILFGSVSMCLGGGLLSTLYPAVSSGHWIGYQIFIGIGYALGTNMAQLGMQASLPQALVPIGATSLLTVIAASCAIFLAVGQTIFQDRLQKNLPVTISSALRTRLAYIGPTSLRSSVNPADLQAVLNAYSKSITQVWYLPAAAPVLAFVLICFCRWTSLKKDKEVALKFDEAEQGASASTEVA